MSGSYLISSLKTCAGNNNNLKAASKFYIVSVYLVCFPFLCAQERRKELSRICLLISHLVDQKERNNLAHSQFRNLKLLLSHAGFLLAIALAEIVFMFYAWHSKYKRPSMPLVDAPKSLLPERSSPCLSVILRICDEKLLSLQSQRKEHSMTLSLSSLPTDKEK